MSSGRNRKEPGTATDHANEQRIGELIPGSLASLDTTLPPTPLKKLLEADGASVHLLTGDHALSEVVEEAAGHQYPVHVHTEWAELMALIESGRCRIVLLDADMVGSAMEARIKQLHAAAGSLVVLVAAPRDAAQRLIGLLSERSVHRLLIKPAAVGITRLLLESAVSRYLQLRDQATDAADNTINTPYRKPRETEHARLPSWIIAVALVSLLVGALAVTSFVRFGTDGGDQGSGAAPGSGIAGRAVSGPGNEPTIAVVDEPVAADPVETVANDPAGSEPLAADRTLPSGSPPVASAAEPSSSGPSGSSAQASRRDDAAAAASSTAGLAPVPANAAELAAATQALRDGRLTDPAGDGALSLFAAAVARAPDDEVARNGLNGALDAAFAAVEAALLDDDLDAAADVLEGIRRVQPASGRVSFLQAQLAAARSAAAASASAERPGASGADGPAAAPPASPSELDSLLTLARARLDRGALIEPAGDSARDYLARAQAINPNDADVFFVRSDLAAAIAESARLVLDAGDAQRAGELVDEAARLGADSDALALLDLDLTAARAAAAAERQRTRLGLALDLLNRGQLIQPADASAEFHLMALRNENPGLVGLSNAWLRLAAAESERARQALTTGNLADADVWVAALERAAPDSEVTRSVRADLDASRRQIEYLRTPARPEELAVARAGSVTYPQDALRREIEGSVLVEFVVDTMGQPTDIRVIEATEPGWFEDAAIESVAGYRYLPFELDGRVYERLARLRINFDLQ